MFGRRVFQCDSSHDIEEEMHYDCFVDQPRILELRDLISPYLEINKEFFPVNVYRRYVWHVLELRFTFGVRFLEGARACSEPSQIPPSEGKRNWLFLMQYADRKDLLHVGPRDNGQRYLKIKAVKRLLKTLKAQLESSYDKVALNTMLGVDHPTFLSAYFLQEQMHQVEFQVVPIFVHNLNDGFPQSVIWRW